MIVDLLFALALPDPAPPVRAELCLAHVNAMIAQASRETGRVAGPSWFIRDWWSARLPEDGAPGALTAEQRTALELSLAERRTTEADDYQTELQSCADEAIDGGALP